MEDSLIQRPPRKNTLSLQLTAMIDIFSMIVIFLILGSVFGASSIFIPENLSLPKSVSKETVDSAPILTVEKDKVTFGLFNAVIPMADFLNEGRLAAAREALTRQFKEKFESPAQAVQKNPQKIPQKIPKMVNVIADKDLTYETVFRAIRLFREIGFQTLLFSAEGEGVKK